jgi:hypothetical protein
MGCGPQTIGCDPLSDDWEINVNRAPMVVVDNTPQIRVGESLQVAVFTFGRVLCPQGNPVRSVTWQVGNPTVVALTQGKPFPDEATILGLAPGETSIVAQIVFDNGSTTRTESLWAAVNAPRNVVRVVP